MKDITKTYSNGEVTIVWKPSLCIHSAICWRNHDSLPEVFNPAKKPWIQAQNASTERIVEQIKKCPSGALSYRMNEPEVQKKLPVTSQIKVVVKPNGPLLLNGTLEVSDANGTVVKENVTAFCRCGASANKPYCDGSHNKINFKG